MLVNEYNREVGTIGLG